MARPVASFLADKEYYKTHDVELDQVLTHGLPLRFIRCNPRFNQTESLNLLKKDLGGIDPHPVPWLEGYFAIPGSVGIQKTRAFQEARVYGQDVSSGAAVATLLSDSNCESTTSSLRILELCTAPGLKLCAIADYLLNHAANPAEHVVVGVELSETRMAACKRIVRKYQLSASDYVKSTVRTKLYQNDGTRFGLEPLNLVFDSSVAKEQLGCSGIKRKRMNKSARAREKKRLLETVGDDLIPKSEIVRGGAEVKAFDLVLVDAECSNDGSLVHLQKRLDKAHTPTESSAIPLALCTETVNQLVLLQRNLIERGFALLRSGGTLVYSTCSLSYEQNEGVIQWFLDRHSADAETTQIHFDIEDPLFARNDNLGSIRFLPNTDRDSWASKRLFGGGFFISSIRKK